MLSIRSPLQCRIIQQCHRGSSGNNFLSSSGNRFMSKATPPPPPGQMTAAQRDSAIRHANKEMKGYVETRILAKQGKLPSKRKNSQKTSSQHKIQFSLFVSLSIAFIASPVIGRKIAYDDEFREKYIPSWYDFRVKAPESAWTRQELHEQLVAVEKDMRERAIKGEFTPEKLEEMKGSLQARSDLTEEDMFYAKKYGWGRVHPGIDEDDEDDDDY